MATQAWAAKHIEEAFQVEEHTTVVDSPREEPFLARERIPEEDTLAVGNPREGTAQEDLKRTALVSHTVATTALYN